MRVLGTIGLGLILMSIISVLLWSPAPYSILQDLDTVVDRVHQGELKFINKNISYKANTIPHVTTNNVKEKIDDENLYKNSMTKGNYDATTKIEIKPTIDKVSKWIGIKKDPSTIDEHLNIAEEKTHEATDSAMEAGSHIIDVVGMASKDVKDATYCQSAKTYKQTAEAYDQTKNFAKGQASKIIHSAKAVIDKTDKWIANSAHNVFDQTSDVASNVENIANEIAHKTHNIFNNTINENFIKRDLKNSQKIPNKNFDNKKNLMHDNLELLRMDNMQRGIRNATNIAHNNLKLLGVDNSDDFITENTHTNPQKLDEQCAQMSKDTGLNLIERSFKEVNNLWSSLMEDGTKASDENKNICKESLNHDYRGANDQSNNHQNENYYDNIKKRHYKMNVEYQKNLPDDSNHESFKDKKNIDDLQMRMDETYTKYKPQKHNYNFALRYGEKNYNNAKEKTEQYFEGVKSGYKGVKVGAKAGTLYQGVQGTYEGAKIGAQVGYKVGKHYQGTKDNARHYYEDVRQKSTKAYKNVKDATKNNLQHTKEKFRHLRSNTVDQSNYDEQDDSNQNGWQPVKMEPNRVELKPKESCWHYKHHKPCTYGLHNKKMETDSNDKLV